MRRRKLLGIGAGLAVLPAVWAVRLAVAEDAPGWHTETAPLERVFPELGPLTDARWVSSRDDDDRGVPSPELVVSGYARLAPGKLDALTAAHPFAPGTPPAGTSWFEKPLQQGAGPKDPDWVRSDSLDRDGSGARVTFWFDRRTGTVRFWALNPHA
ncbi:hypothetical protein ACIA8O_03945 [Kitasatospora sp. NPDC051853]|uniref:hypothetical protein n=1 Tax=Kitasatospora sp. NPDC051853 TaxID=3364058 RepID=UPI003795B8CC